MTGFDPGGRQLYYDGDFRESESSGSIDVVNPATEAQFGRVADTDAEEVERIVARANEAQADWADTDPKTRAAVLHDIADEIESTGYEEAAKVMTRDHGKPFPDAEGELANVAPVFRYYAVRARHDGGSVPGSTQSESFQFAKQFPYGVSVHIVPSNFPVLLLCWTVAASLAAGNAAIVKPSEQTPLSTLQFMRHFEALPDGLVACVTGRGETAQALIQSDGTDAVAFTGGVETGKKVASACAEQLMPSVIEAGGNDPMVVTEHAPMDVAVPGSATAAFHLSGQVCTSSERFYVHEAVHDEFVDGLVDMATNLRVGNGLGASEIGPLVSEAARDEVARLVDDAVENGATVACGGRVPPDQDTGWFYEPTVLTGVTPEMDIVQQEVFGPVAPVCEVESLDEALSLANDTEYGLGSSLFTTDLQEAMRAYETLESGMVWVNNPMIDNDAIPFGGWKQSGVGRELGKQGLDAFRQTKMGVLDWNPKTHDWWFPYPEDWFYEGGAERF
jgi:acyl-CoA reductase-like NAD-dependent aldehyde dehydrogenase